MGLGTVAGLAPVGVALGASASFSNSSEEFIESVIPQEKGDLASFAGTIALDFARESAFNKISSVSKNVIAKSVAKQYGKQIAKISARKGVSLGAKMAGRLAGRLAVNFTTKLTLAAARVGAKLSGGPITAIFLIFDLANIGFDLWDPNKYNQQMRLKDLLEARKDFLDDYKKIYDEIEVVDPKTGKKYTGKNVPQFLGGPIVWPQEVVPFYHPGDDPETRDEFLDNIIDYYHQHGKTYFDDSDPDISEEDIIVTKEEQDIIDASEEFNQNVSKARKEIIRRKSSSPRGATNNQKKEKEEGFSFGWIFLIIFLVILIFGVIFFLIYYQTTLSV